MSPPIPTTQELTEQLVASISSSINQTIPFLPKGFYRVLSVAIAGILIVLYKFASFIFLQIFVATASFKETTINGRKITPLIFWGRLLGVGDPDPATKAELLVDITVESQGGTLIGGETNLIGSLNGVTYTLQSDVLLDADIVQGTFRASSDPNQTGGAGAQGNLSTGDILTFATPYGDVAQDAVVNARTADGADGEGKEIYGGKVERRFGGRPQGGAGVDYVYWGTEVDPGIINGYIYTGSPGEVDTYWEATPESSGNPDGIPTTAQLDDVKAAIEKDAGGLALNRPIGSFVNVYPITRNGYTVDITDLTGEDLPTLKINIEDALTIHLWEREPYIDGVTPLPRKQNITLDNIRSIVNDFAEAANGSYSSVVLKYTVSGIAFDVYTLTEGEKAKLTVVNYLTTP